MEECLLKQKSNSIISYQKNAANLQQSPEIKKFKKIPIDSNSVKLYYIDQKKTSPGRKKFFKKTNTMTETQVNFLFSDKLGDLKQISISKLTESASNSSKNQISGNSKGSKKKKLKSQRGKNGIRRQSTISDSFKNRLYSKMNFNHFPNGPNFNINIINHQQCRGFNYESDLVNLPEIKQENLHSDQ
jgi:hypothetical protein